MIRSRRSLSRRAFAPVAILAVCLVWSTTAEAGTLNPRVLPPNSTAYGHTYGDWSAAWWQYVLAQPAATNPLYDASGAGCRAGQSGQVFFLVGVNGSSDTVTRRGCTVPAGKALFFPLVNAFDNHVPCPGNYCDSNDTPEKLWADFQSYGFSVSSLYATLDSVNVENLDAADTPYRACAGPATAGCDAPSFYATLPANNLFPGLAPGTYLTVADGVYLLVAPLPPGPHTISFGGKATFAGSSFAQNITYDLTVSPG